MRQALRAVVLFLLGVVGAVFLGAAMAITAAVSLAATALIVPGTGTPVADQQYMENVRDYYLDGTACAEDQPCTLQSIEYPASFWPMPFPGWCRSGANGCDTWNVSVAKGVTDLDEQFDAWLAANPDNEERLVIFGYSQGGQVVSNEMRDLAATLTDDQKKRVEIVMIGSIANPDGGLWPRLSPFSLLTQLLLDATLGPPMITDSGIKTTVIGFEYDPVVYSPKYWGNPLAVLNALAAFDTVHGQYLAGPNRPGSGSLPYGYTVEELELALKDPKNIRTGSDGNTYVMIPAKSLPLADLILNLADSAGIKPFVKPIVDLLAPMAKVIIDLGYDWSGDPDVPQSLSLLPFNPNQNWLEVGAKLVAAAIEGVEAFLRNFDAGATADAVTPPESGALLRAAVSEIADAEFTDPAQLAAGTVADEDLSADALQRKDGVPVQNVAIDPTPGPGPAPEPVPGAVPTAEPVTLEPGTDEVITPQAPPSPGATPTGGDKGGLDDAGDGKLDDGELDGTKLDVRDEVDLKKDDEQEVDLKKDDEQEVDLKKDDEQEVDLKKDDEQDGDEKDEKDAVDQKAPSTENKDRAETAA